MRPNDKDAYPWGVRAMRRRNLVSFILIVGLLTVAGFLSVVPGGEAVTELTELTYSPEERHRICEEIWEKIGLWYSYFDDKGIDWESVRQCYLHQVAGVESDYEFFVSMSALVRELDDGHSYMCDYPRQVSSARGRPRIHIAETEGKPIVAKVAFGSDAEAQGIVPGLTILSVDGEPSKERINRLVPRVHSSTPWHRRSVAVAAVLEGDLDEQVKVELESRDGKVFSLRLLREPFVAEPMAITAAVLDGDIGLLTLPSFSASRLGLKSGDDLVKAFDAALEQLREMKALIIDMRGNGGGDDRVAQRCAGRFFTSSVAFPGFQMRMVTLGKPWFAPRIGRAVSPRGEWQYSGPVVLLIDEFVISSAEHFVAGMHDSGRATTIGHTTAGSSGNPIRLEVSGFKFQVSRWREYRADGSLIEGQGVPADISVSPTVDDIAGCIDRALICAVDYLKSYLSRSSMRGNIPDMESAA
jgi:C-terminal processing protease CtpA/Prc